MSWIRLRPSRSRPERAAAAGSAATRRRLLVAALLALAIATSLAMAHAAFETGPLPSFSGVPPVADKPGEYNCSVCHANYDWNNIDTPGGAVELIGLPVYYEPNVSYPLTVRLHSDSTAAFPGRRWGFQLTAVRALDGEGCGTFEVDSETLQVVFDPFGPFASRRYVTHTELGRRDSLSGGASWSFAWRAPSAVEDSVIFCLAGVAANGDAELNHDFVFTFDGRVADVVTPTRNMSWGSLKARYR